jgi:hypothetical protein
MTYKMSVVQYFFYFAPILNFKLKKGQNIMLGKLYLANIIIPVAEIINGKIEIFSKHQRFLIATESSKYLLIFVLYVCVILCEFGTAISKRYACFCCLLINDNNDNNAEYECQLKLYDQNIICNCHFPNNFRVYKYNVVVYPLIS